MLNISINELKGKYVEWNTHFRIENELKITSMLALLTSIKVVSDEPLCSVCLSNTLTS